MQFLMNKVNSVGSQAGIYLLYLERYTVDFYERNKQSSGKIESVIENAHNAKKSLIETYIQKRMLNIKIMNM